MAEHGPYSRVYHSIVDDPKFVTVYDNNDHLSTWLRLLMLADSQWPASAPLPANARRASVKALVDALLVDLVPGGRYRIRGLDAERNRRSDDARNAANVRWQSVRNAPALPEHRNGNARAALLDETSKAKTSIPRARPSTVDKDPLYREMREAVVRVNGDKAFDK